MKKKTASFETEIWDTNNLAVWYILVLNDLFLHLQSIQQEKIGESFGGVWPKTPWHDIFFKRLDDVF